VEFLAQIQQLNSTIESLKIEKESADAAQLDTVWIESSLAQSLISERVKTITQTQIDLAVEAKMKEDMDAWFSEGNEWCWKKNPLLIRIVDYVRTRMAPAVASDSFSRETAIDDYFGGPNEHLWKAQPAVAEHVRNQVLKAQRTAVSDFLSDDAWMTHPTVWNHIRTQRKEAIDDYFINEHTWKSDPRIEEYVLNEVRQQIETPATAYWNEGDEALLKIGRSVREAFLERNGIRASGQRDEEVIKRGFKAANFASPVADASLYRRATSPRTDIKTFSHLYGVDWQKAWAMRKCKSFETVVGMHGTVSSWHPRDFYKVCPIQTRAI
jgi:hypothetical protein